MTGTVDFDQLASVGQSDVHLTCDQEIVDFIHARSDAAFQSSDVGQYFFALAYLFLTLTFVHLTSLQYLP